MMLHFFVFAVKHIILSNPKYRISSSARIGNFPFEITREAVFRSVMSVTPEDKVCEYIDH